MGKRVVISLVWGFIFSLIVYSAFAGYKGFSGPLAPLNFYYQAQQDSTDKEKLPYPVKDRQGDFLTDENDNPFLLDDPSLIKKEVEYDPETGRYIITETIDGRNVKPPTYLTFEEYLAYERRESNKQYWKERADAISLVEKKGVIPRLYVTGKKFDKIFGGTTIDIRPSGYIELTFGGNVQKTGNPTLPAGSQRNGGFDFDMNINMNVTGKIGEKVKVNMSYNTQATFDFENQIKLNYEGEEDDIIKLIEAGNVSFPLPTTLIQGKQSLFGLKTKLQFGRLTITNVYSQQKSRSENLTIDQGAQTSNFQIYADQYDENRHFFLAQYFRDNYNTALRGLPNINSLVNITKVEVWVTNDRRATEDTRDIVGFMDLGENEKLYNTADIMRLTETRPSNNANNLYARLKANPNTQSIDKVVTTLENQFNLEPVEDFEKTNARKLSPTEYSYHPQLGYISLTQSLNSDEVLAVAYEYTLNGATYKVGEFAQDVTNDIENNTQDSSDIVVNTKVVILKLLKSTSAKPTLPIWDLMMKNIYSIGAFQVNAEDFKLNVLYQDPGGGIKRYIPEPNEPNLKDPLLSVLELDNLNTQLDPQRDGIFDFIPGVTIHPQNGRVIFPVVEPFGNYLRQQFSDSSSASRYVYDQLYDSTKVIAQQYPQFNRFTLEGSYKSSVSNEISLGAFNVPEGSVKVTAGGQQLTEGVDYTVDYSLGRVRIINEGILNSGLPVNVSYENNALFGFQTKTLFGMRLDYRVSEKFNIGSTMLHLRERPFTEKVNIGDDPISNLAWGMDFNYNTESQFMTWMVDKLPLYETKEKSTFAISGEVANLKPGHQRAIGDEGTVYIDDFEGTSSNYDLKFPATSWALASTPRDARDQFGRILFPEAVLTDTLPYGYNRARLAWYNIDPLYQTGNVPEGIDLNNHYGRYIEEQEVFPNRDQLQDFTANNIVTFDLAYYPEERGPYNFDVEGVPGISAGVGPDGKLNDPESRWGGIMRRIDNTDFEASNIEFIEFWVMDPFFYESSAEGGDLFINLGNVSEDILKDSRKFFENGLVGPNSPTRLDTTAWGLMPRNQPITNSFDNDADKRQYQDVGFDGWNDLEEANFFSDYLDRLSTVILDPAALDSAFSDPSSDNYRYHTNYSDQTGVLERYKKYNNPQGNSPVSRGNSEAATTLPDTEDLNQDLTLNETEAYFQYRVHLEPEMEVGEQFINDKVRAPVNLPNNDLDTISWYQFRIPIDEYERRVGNISDFKSIRFIRMFLTDFENPVVLRFARLDLVRNQWRRYQLDLKQPGEGIPSDDINNTFFNVAAVNIEENSEKEPVNYVLPPGIEREQNLSSQNIVARQNEQALQIEVCNLADNDSRAVYKTLNLDLRTYKTLKMYIHGESADPSNPVDDGEVTVFLRLGSDFTDNYYEYEIPLQITPPGFYDPVSEVQREIVWPEENEIVIDLERFYKFKLNPGDTTGNPDSLGRRITVVGNPDLGLTKVAMIGIRNPKAELIDGRLTDDGLPKCVEVWVNEMRLSGLDESGGWAATARMEAQFADLANIVFSTNMHTQGYGQIEQRVQERYKDDFWQYDLAGSMDLGKFIPKKVGFRIPMYASISQSFSTPQYDPYELDVPLDDKLTTLAADGEDVKSYKRQVQTLETIKSLNFTNVRIVSQNREKKPRFYDPSNLYVTFAITSTERSDPYIESDFTKRYKAELGYNYSPQPKYLFPFKKAIKSKSKYLDIVRDINVNFMPNNLSFRTTMNRQFSETRLRPTLSRNLEGNEVLVEPPEPTYDKYFKWDRFYGLKINPFRSVSVDFTAVNYAIVDEPQGRLTKGNGGRDSLWTNIGKFGRTTNYQHTFNASYNTPLNKIPFLSWVQGRAGYGATYNWLTGGYVRDFDTEKIILNPWGNIINNSQDIKLNGELNFKDLYDKIKVLKPYNSSRAMETDRKKRLQKIESNQKRKEQIDNNIEELNTEIAGLKQDIKDLRKDKEAENKKDQIRRLKTDIKAKKQRIKKLKQDRSRIESPESPFASPFIRPIIAVKRVSMNFTEGKTTTLPGYLPTTMLLGMSKGFNSPGWKFIFGYQPDQAWLEGAANRGWITSDTSLNYQFLQSTSRNLNFKAVVEPWRDIRVDLTLNKTTTENYSEYFKRQFEGGGFEHLTPQTTGSYIVSYIAIQTLFRKPESNGSTITFREFEENRKIISQRLSNLNNNSEGPFIANPEEAKSDTLNGYREGYGPYSQDAIIPAFIAAYSGKDANTIDLSPLKVFPLPNWRVTYNGLTKFPAFKKIFKSVSITHAYNSTYAVNSYITNFEYSVDQFGDADSIDSDNQNFNAQYRIPQVVITEQLSPLIGVDITWINGITTRFDYKRTRNLSLSLIDYQLSESRTTEMTFGFGYRLKGLNLPFKIRGKKRRLENDINFRLDFSFRDNVTINQRLDQEISEPTQGAKTIRVGASIDYVINSRLNIKIFFDRSRTIPATSASYPITNTKAGVTLRFSLTQ